MPKLYRSREGDVTAIQTKTQLTTLGSESAPGPILVPAQARTLNAVIAAFSSNFAAANDCIVFIRLEGPGLKDGPETLTLGGAAGAVATGGTAARKAERTELNINVIPSQEIIIFAEMDGEDIGQFTAGVTLEFGL